MKPFRVRELRGILVAPSGRRFAVVDETGGCHLQVAGHVTHYLEPHLVVIEVSGRWAGVQFTVPTAQVETWRREEEAA